MKAGVQKPKSEPARARPWPVIIFALCAVGFALGLFQLFKLRFEAGDVYPEYSSLRADPLGTMALCESLGQMPGISVRRDFSESNLLPTGKGTTYLHLAGSPREWQALPAELVQEIERFLNQGGRLAITFFPETSAWAPFFSSPAPAKPKSSKANPSTGPKRKKKNLPDEENLVVSLKERWGLEFGFVKLQSGKADAFEPVTVRNQTDLPLPDELEWHSGLIFTNLATSWHPIYARGRHSVVIERGFGAGTVVMATDSFFLSNEALLKDRHADLLAWLIGSSRQVVFDEAHLGVVESQGVAKLLRKYRLHWVAAGLLLIAGLFVWKNSTSFAPPYPEERTADVVLGRDAAAGFVNLLRRNVPARDVLNVCFAEWTKSLLQGNTHLIARVDQAQTALEAENSRPPLQRDPDNTYRAICHILKAAGRSVSLPAEPGPGSGARDPQAPR